MSKKYQAAIQVKELERLIDEFSSHYNIHPITVFRDFMRYAIHGWTVPGYPGYADWPYTMEQNKEFAEMHRVWISIMNEQLEMHPSFDAFAQLQPIYYGKKEAKSKGQFMTPVHISRLMSSLVLDDNDKIGCIIDPAGGSAGLLLAAHAEKPRNFYVSWDVDYTMCLQAVLNFMIHGVVGMVVCIDTLSLKNFQGAWLVNEYYYRTGLPSIRPMTEEEWHLHEHSNRLWTYFLSTEQYGQLENLDRIWLQIKEMSKK